MTRALIVIAVMLGGCAAKLPQLQVTPPEPTVRVIVFQRAADGSAQSLGEWRAGSRPPIQRPEGNRWWIEPVDKLSDTELQILGRAITRHAVPGLSLRGQRKLDSARLALLGDLSRLYMLDLTDTHAGDEALARLHGTTLRALYLGGTKVTVAGLRAVGALAQLEVLTLDRTGTTDDGVAQLAHLPALVTLDLSETAIDDDGAAMLAVCASLSELYLGATAVGDRGIAALATLPLTVLHLPETRVTDRSAPVFAGFDGLRELVLWRTAITDAGLRAISTLTQLGLLDLGQTDVTSRGMRLLARLATLEVLDVSDDQVDDEGVHALARLPRLRQLELQRAQVSDTGVAWLRGLPLRSLGLDGTFVTDAVLEPLAALPLEALGLSSTRVSESFLTQLSGVLLKLRELRLAHTGLRATALAHLERFPALTALDLSGLPVDDAALMRLVEKLPKLRSLVVVKTQVTPQRLRALAALHRSLQIVAERPL